MLRGLACLALLSVGGCGDTADDTGVGDQPYCTVFRDANTSFIEPGGGNGESGYVLARLVTDKADDIRDPNFVAFVDYTLENLDVGGSQTLGESTQEGDVIETLGAGNWRIKLNKNAAGYNCYNEFDFLVEAGNSTTMCLDVGCE